MDDHHSGMLILLHLMDYDPEAFHCHETEMGLYLAMGRDPGIPHHLGNPTMEAMVVMMVAMVASVHGKRQTASIVKNARQTKLSWCIDALHHLRHVARTIEFYWL